MVMDTRTYLLCGIEIELMQMNIYTSVNHVNLFLVEKFLCKVCNCFKIGLI